MILLQKEQVEITWIYKYKIIIQVYLIILNKECYVFINDLNEIKYHFSKNCYQFSQLVGSN